MAGEKETRAVLAAITIAYPGRFRLDRAQLEQTIQLWGDLLSDLPDGSAIKACRALVASREHPPSISEVRAEALSVRLAKGRPEAGEAWSEVVKAIGQVGRNRSPRWSSPAVARAVDAIGGWQHVCNSENVAADRAKFVDNYTGQMATAERQVLTGEAPSVEAALELRLPLNGLAFVPDMSGPAPQIAEAEKPIHEGTLIARDLGAQLGKKFKR